MAALLLLVPSTSTAVPSPWCQNASAPPVPGMYGNLGNADLVGPRGASGFFIDLPQGVAPLFAAALAHLWGFNNVEAHRGFSATVVSAPDCALCHWGVAASLASNINYDIEDQGALNRAAEAAVGLAAHQPSLTQKTRRLIAAIACLQGNDVASRQRYANALCDTPEAASDPDVATLCAGALMATTPWRYYNGTAGGKHEPLLPAMVPVKRLLLANIDLGIGGGPHAFAIHLLIHLLEPTNAPEGYRWLAVGPTQELFETHGAALVPAQGHLTHMPAHLFLRVGRYAEAVATAQRSIDNNERYLAACLHPYGYGHNLKMLVANARFAGMSGRALQSAHKTLAPAAGAEATPAGGDACVDCAGAGSPEVVLTMARFGMWEALLAEAVPTSWGHPRWTGYNEAAFRLARALALYALGQRETSADAEARAAVAAAADDWKDVVPAEAAAVRAWRVTHDGPATVAAYERAVAAMDAIPYLEPPRWYFPLRQCLGYVLLTPAPGGGTGHVNATQALAVFTADLQNYPENAFSLLGTAKALRALGRANAALDYDKRSTIAWQFADVPLHSPCQQLA